MLTFEKLSSHPQTFSRLTGVSTGLFSEMAEKIRPLWDVRRDNCDEGARAYNLSVPEEHLTALLIHKFGDTEFRRYDVIPAEAGIRYSENM